jgi:hypothetical protein
MSKTTAKFYGKEQKQACTGTISYHMLYMNQVPEYINDLNNTELVPYLTLHSTWFKYQKKLYYVNDLNNTKFIWPFY